MTYIKGNLKQIIYKTDKGFIVGLFKINDTDNNKDYLNKSIVFTGNFHDLRMEIEYILHGDFVEHPKYGEQFLVTAFEQIMPESSNGIISFLSSKLFPGVGVKLATKIVDTLGDNVIALINEDYHNLLLVQTVTEKKALKIQNILKSESESYQIIINLQKMGFSMNEASKIYKQYKQNTMIMIEDNIYNIINDVTGISFITVDKIAAATGYLEDDERRLKACIIYVMSELCFINGNVYNDEQDIYDELKKYLSFSFSIDDFNYYLLKLNKDNKIIINNNHYYLKDYYDAEVFNARFLITLLSNKGQSFNNIDKYISKLEKTYSLKYNKLQKEAIKQSILNNFIVITGGPGTGKTTIIKAIVELYIELNNITLEKASSIIALLAPTGRAAKRITETTGVDAMTIHKFLKWNKETNEFGINEFNKANVKFVIVDEVSMIDHFLLNNLFKGLPTNVQMIFVGDHNQLPSVGPGEILKDLINAKDIPIIELNDLYRQKENSYIVSLAHEIKNGTIPSKFDSKQGDYNFVEARSSDINYYVLELCKKALEKGYSYKEIQVLIPMYKGTNGIDNFNGALQDIFNPSNNKNTFLHNNVTYRVGDKVLQIKNNNDLNISNGDIGIIEEINYYKGAYSIVINFNDDLFEYSATQFDDLRLGYAISIHKAQGSEFDIVILPMDLSYSRMLYRKLLYTAVTRAKKALMIVGDKEAFKKAVINKKEQKRKTSLTYWLDINNQ